MEKNEKKQEMISRGELLAKALQSRLQELKEKGEPLRTDTVLYILKDVPGRFKKD